MPVLAERLAAVRDRIAQAASLAGRDPAQVRLLAVSKGQPVQALLEATELGQRLFGENYLQEALPKMMALGTRGVEWHFIGPLQSNKARDVARRFDWVHSLDRPKLVELLAKGRPPDRLPLNVLIEVNIDGEAGKAGCEPDAALKLAQLVAAQPTLRLRGLMTIPRPSLSIEAQRKPYRRLHGLYAELIMRGFVLDTLSMGMSADLEAAVAEGAHIVRVGTALFGERT